MERFRPVWCVILVACSAPLAQAHEEVEMDVGQNAAGQLKIAADFHHPIELEASIFPGILGYAFAEPAFHSTILSEPDRDLFPLSLSSSLQFILLAKDPGIEVWNDTGSDFLPVGGAFYIGPPVFDTHPVWNIPSGSPGEVFTLTLKVHDVNGIYPDSDPVVLSFTPAPEPATLMAFALAALGLSRRLCRRN